MESGCLYVPAFPAWAVARALPGSGPVVVLAAGRAVSWSRVPALREVRTGDRVDRVLRLCPEARVHRRDASLEDAAWEDLLQRLHEVTPFIAPARPPFVCFRAEVGPAPAALADATGVRIGLAEDRAAARLAAVRAADRHVLALPSGGRQRFLRRFPVDLLAELGYPEVLPERLRRFGYDTLGAMESLTRRHLEAQFGPDGVSLHALLHPSPDPPVPAYVLPPSRSAAFEAEEAMEPGAVDAVLRLLAGQAAAELGELRCQRMVVELHVARRAEPRIGSRLLPEPHRDPGALARFALRLYSGIATPGDRVERIVLRLEALRRPSVTQASLFDLRPALMGAVRRVHRRYPEAIRRAVVRNDALFPEDGVLFEAFERTHDAA